MWNAEVGKEGRLEDEKVEYIEFGSRNAEVGKRAEGGKR
jgi:hypothetical protein